MKVEKLISLNKTVLSSDDGWGYEINAYEDVTEIVYYEVDYKGEKEIKDKFTITSGYDLQVFEKAIELRNKVDTYEIE